MSKKSQKIIPGTYRAAYLSTPCTQSHPFAPNRPEKEKERYSYYFEVVEEIKFDRGIKLGLGTEIDFCDVQKNGSFEHFFYTIEHFSVPVLFTVVFSHFFRWVANISLYAKIHPKIHERRSFKLQRKVFWFILIGRVHCWNLPTRSWGNCSAP